MSLINSVNTNVGAMIALESLNKTNAQMASVQKQVSTGYRVADATDDGAAFAVAQSVRSTVGSLTTANQQLGTVQGLLSTTQSGLTNVSNTMSSMRDVLLDLTDTDVTGNQRAQYVTQYQSLLASVKNYVTDAGYNGKTLIGNITGSNGTFARVQTIRNEFGASYGIATFGGSALYGSINFSKMASQGYTPASSDYVASQGYTAKNGGTAASWATPGTGTAASWATAAMTAGAFRALISASGTFTNMQNSVGTALNTVGAEVNFVNNQVSYNNDKVDALNSGLGSLVDADLAKESAQLQALQIRQQLGTQALSLANQAPQTLLSLFK